METNFDCDRSISELLRDVCLANPFEFEPESPYIAEVPNQGLCTTSSPILCQIQIPELRAEHDLAHGPFSPIYSGANQNLYPVLMCESLPSISSQITSEPGYNWISAESSKKCTPKDDQFSTRHNSLSSIRAAKQRLNQKTGKTDTFGDYRSPRSISRSESNYLVKEITSNMSPNLNLRSKRLSSINMSDKFTEYHDSEGNISVTQLKRFRSTTKKMFGEKGWLGMSPDEALNLGRRACEKTSALREKTSMIERLRNKIGEIAEKADIKPHISHSQRENKTNKVSALSISLGAQEQASIYMELEVMIVRAANLFLMNNFSQGRMCIDTIKRTVDTWKSKGRPTVIEFMYDQATQRDLIALNQHNIYFHGKEAQGDLRINSMLCNWKQVAALMAVRTFCSTDTTILKILFDTEQILILIGAGNSMILRLRQIRDSAVKIMKQAYQMEAEITVQSCPSSKYHQQGCDL